MECVKPLTMYSKFRKLPDGFEHWTPAFTMRWYKNQRSRKVTVPCGKCAFCLTNRRSGWMFRIGEEMRTQEHRGYFLTLTYGEKYIKRVGPEGRPSLRFRDVQLYLKRIRKAKYYAKYICVGEYGGQTGRPHYHMLLWTDAPTEFLEANWKLVLKDGKDALLGHIMFGKLEMASAMYTLKYIIQPKHVMSDDDPREKTRAQFSKGLGIGYLDHRAYGFHTSSYDDPELMCFVDGRKVALPLYYKRKIFTKFQLANAALDLSLERHKEERLKVRKLRDRGICHARRYLLSLRLEECNRILKRTKFNLTL